MRSHVHRLVVGMFCGGLVTSSTIVACIPLAGDTEQSLAAGSDAAFDSDLEVDAPLPADAPRDAAFDTGLSADAARDAAFDAPRDAAFDAPRDAAFDAPRDAAFDAPGDAVFDAPGDAVFDAPGDAVFDAPGDAVFDAPPADGPSTMDAAPTDGNASPMIALDRSTVQLQQGVDAGAVEDRVRITNRGAATLVVGAVRRTGDGDWSARTAIACPCDLAPNMDLDVIVSFDPSVEDDALDAMLEIDSNDPAQPIAYVALHGVGVPGLGGGGGNLSEQTSFYACGASRGPSSLLPIGLALGLGVRARRRSRRAHLRHVPG